ncbi:TIGR02680 family protein [Kineococcus sp. LSe6-4]|uniref:TIGR02680 family protein n=1 Tax=Kineococcus halophytocola TaxID=3234027 RepID=A0ABV4H806_9ACTN
MNSPADLPRPTTTRWRPLRAGLVDLYYYDVEEFWFHDGRLLLRGNNGAGKSKVLALTLPFLLDGDLASHRVEPDGDRKKRMEWNLLLDGAHPHSERTGYTWLELGRLDRDGREEFRTLGCGMKAVTGRGIARHWFFSTSERVGRDLFLVDRAGTALPRERLIDALGDAGVPFDSQWAYRRHVDETLFRLGKERYGALVDLLVQLRRPQLTKRPDAAALSAALTEALPPLDPQVLADVAEAFRSLEDDRRDLHDVLEAREAATAFLRHYRRYARAAVKRRTGDVRRAQSRYEAVGRDVAQAERDHTAATERLTTATGGLTQVREQLTDLSARQTALAGDQRLSTLAEAETSAELATTAALDARRAADGAQQRLNRARGTRDDRSARLGEARERFETALTTLTGRAGAAGILLPEPPDPTAQDPTAQDPTSYLDTVRAAAQRRGRETQHVQTLLREQADAQAHRNRRQQDSDRARAEVDRIAERSAEADLAVERAADTHVGAVTTALDTARELRLDDVTGVLAELRGWTSTVDGPSPLPVAADETVGRVTRDLATARAEATGRNRALTEREVELTAERSRLQAGEDTEPPLPPTRTADRAGRPGAPLWRVVDFAPDLPATDRAGLEAALQASGLLDAWVLPDPGTPAPDGDVVVRTGPPVDGPSLLDVLRPALDGREAAPLTEDTVRAALATVAWDRDDATSAVAPDGTFRLGVLTGRWSVPEARFIGRSAREAARRARLADVEAELTTNGADRGAVREELAELDRRANVLATERRALPDDADLRAAHARRTSLAEAAVEADAAVRRADADLATAVAASEAADLRAREGARELRLDPDPAAVAAVAAAVADVQASATELQQRWETVTRSAQDLASAEEDVAAADDDAQRAEVVLREREEAATTARTRAQTLRESLGRAVEDLQAQLAAVRDDLDRARKAVGPAEREKSEAERALGEVAGRRSQLTLELQAAEEVRDGAVAELRTFAASGIVAVAGADLDVPDTSTPWAPTPAVAFARRADTAIPEDLDEKEWQRSQDAVTAEVKNLTDTLARRGNTATWSLVADVIVVDVRYAGRTTTVPDLHADLDADAGDRQRLLDAREREVLENHLVAEVAGELQDLIRAAERQVADMNAELEQRPLSTGMRLRMQWQPVPDGPAGLEEARRRLLRQSADAWSAEDRTAVGEFLQQRIQAVRQESSAGTWLEHLTTALDYRGWHRFSVQRRQNGQWRPADGPASGGEQVLAASVPLFAAASAHYRSAGNPDAPRIITLDEAFAGVDDTARADYLGLLAQFDLDVVMTSEREWACYPQVPGIGIAQLSRVEGVDAVLVTSFRWDGNTRHEIDRPTSQSVVPAPRATPPPEQDDLFS